MLSQAFSDDTSIIGSPLKKQRGSGDDVTMDRSAGFPSAIGDVLGRAIAEQKGKSIATPGAVMGPKDESDDEL